MTEIQLKSFSEKLKNFSENDKEKLKQSLLNCNKTSEVVETFKSLNIEVSEEVAEQILKMKENRGELSDNDLESVAGGGVFSAIEVGLYVGSFFKNLFG